MTKELSGIKALPALMGAALLFIVCSGVLWIWSVRSSADNAQSSAKTAALAQAVALHAVTALDGNADEFASLSASRQEFERASAGIGVDQTQAQKLLERSQRVLDAREFVTAARAAVSQVNQQVPLLLQSLGNLAGGLGSEKLESIKQPLQRFELASLGLQQDVQSLAAGVGDSATLTRRIADELDYLGLVIGEFGGQSKTLGLPALTGPDADQKLKLAATNYRSLSEPTRAVLTVADNLQQAHSAGRELPGAATAVSAALAQSTASTAQSSTLLKYSPLVCLLAALLAVAAVTVIYNSTANIRETAEKQRLQNERNQAAILRLLDEVSTLADGDLTVQATVNEDITGAIADSINSAIEALRELVTTINSTAITLDTSAKQALASVGHLAKASIAQSKQVAAASESVVAMAQSVEEVSGNAERSADVARHSVDVAHKGSDAVRRTIDGMNAIRETIQDTSKRIKRLGESSQEIGNIVELINDIAEQTNILALNASIQASMAGEAGRGFAVVADEVQRLAERAANATKQIEVLVRTIQADTNEAVVSMERSTTDVVGGALLAENAGAALEEIEQVSNQIASLVQNISSSARQQSATAQNIARNMQVLREISAQTAENSSATSHSVGKLALLSGQLRKSVTGFRLPNQNEPAAPTTTAAPAAVVKKPAAALPPDDKAVKNVSAVAG